MDQSRPSTLAQGVLEVAGVQAARCYQCGKCTAGCPMARFMDRPPHRVMRLLQLQDPDADAELLRGNAIWRCAGCLTCTQRCPRQLDPAAVMDVLREEALRRGTVPDTERRILAFHQAFLRTVEQNGRMSELPLLRRYKLASLDLFGDVDLAPRVLARGKMPLMAHRIAGRDQVRRIFATAGRKGHA